MKSQLREMIDFEFPLREFIELVLICLKIYFPMLGISKWETIKIWFPTVGISKWETIEIWFPTVGICSILLSHFEGF